MYISHFQHRTGHIMTSSFMGRGNQYIQLVKVLYCKLLIIAKLSHINIWGLKHQPERWEANVLPLHHHGSCSTYGVYPLIKTLYLKSVSPGIAPFRTECITLIPTSP